MTETPRGLAGRHPIDGYGAGGFQFGGMSHRGSLIALPSGLYPWTVRSAADLSVSALDKVFEQADEIDHLLLGMGADFGIPDEAVAAACRARRIVLEPMATAAAARTYNILLGERRRVAAALIVPDVLAP